MTRQVALLRGINVGRNKRIAMADLRALLEKLGYTDVRTLLQSGNAVLTATGKPATVGRKIEAAIADELGLDVKVVVRTRDELAAVIAGNPILEEVTDPAKHLVVFLSAAPDPARLADIDPAEYAPEVFRLVGRELFLWYPNGVQDAALAPVLTDRKLGVVATARNWSTVTKLLALADGSARH